MKRLFALFLLVLLGWTMTGTLAQRKASKEQTRELEPSKDATLIESDKGVLADSKGITIFVGNTGQPVPVPAKRRGLIAFDLAAIPRRSRILSVVLTVTVEKSAGGNEQEPVTLNLYRVTRSWKEGTSDARGFARGDEAKPGDATWIHSVSPSSFWSHPGGDYVAASSAHTEVSGPGVYTWNSTPKLVADVQAWVKSPKNNFGWILIGDESKRQTAKGFDSRESTDVTKRPQLTVTFR